MNPLKQGNKVANFFILTLCLIGIILIILNLLINNNYILNSVISILLGVIFILQAKYTYRKDAKFMRIFSFIISLINIFIGVRTFIIHM